MEILDGKKLNAEISLQLKSDIQGFVEKEMLVPKLVIFQVGDNPASNIYVGRKVKFAETIGAECEVIKFPESATELEILKEVDERNADKSITGMILQLPVPEHINSRNIFNHFDPIKDVDGLGDVNISKLVNGESDGIIPATARGVVNLLKSNDIEVSGKNVAVIGRSVLVGKSTALNLINNDATVTICHSKTKNLEEILKTSDIIVSAAGQPGLIKSEYLKSDHVVVDISINVTEDSIIGDVESELRHIEPAYISPVPGGVGPMTVVSLFMNLMDSYKIQNNLM
jgi:methylenetetrahydrofolate dehydrogenase (NADP+)/methenyltetrahydrofolate cyclohydrolase